MQEWILDIIKEYVIRHQVRTNSERIRKLHDYFVAQGFDTIALVCDALICDALICDALICDSKVRDILTSKL